MYVCVCICMCAHECLIDFKRHINSSRIILCLEVWELRSLYIYIYIFGVVFFLRVFLSHSHIILSIPI